MRTSIPFIVSILVLAALTSFGMEQGASRRAQAQVPSPTPFPTAVRTFPARAPTSTPLPSDPEAVALLLRSDAVMNELTSVHLEESYDGGVFTVIQDFLAPDRARQDFYRDGLIERQVIRIDTARWERRPEEPWERMADGSALRWPRFDRSGTDPYAEWLGPPVHVRFDGVEEIDGRSTRRVKYECLKFSDEGWITEFWTEWIDEESERLYRADHYDDDPWGSPGVVREMRYSAFDEPVEIERPGTSPGPSPSVPSEPLFRIFVPHALNQWGEV